MRPHSQLLLASTLTLWASLTGGAHAQEAEGPVAADVDPLSVGDTAELAQLPLARPLPERPPAPRAGEVLGAAPGVREVEHRSTVRWSDTVAHVEELWRFRNGGSYPAELRYRQAVPAEASLDALRVCVGARCSEATGEGSVSYAEALDRTPAEDQEAAPIARAFSLDDAAGHAFVVRAAAVPAHGELTLHLRWQVQAPLVGGALRLTLPARGADPRAAPAWIEAEAEGLGATTVNGAPGGRPAAVDAWEGAVIEARAAAGAGAEIRAHSARCGDARCLRLSAWAATRAARAQDVVVALDLSPSASFPRALAALASVLTELPDGSRVMIVGFGARARALTDDWIRPDEVALTALRDLHREGLGPATRFDRAVEVASPWLRGRRPRLVLVSDGRLTMDTATSDAFDALRRGGVAASLLSTDAAPTEPLASQLERTGGRFILAAREAEAAAGSGGGTSGPDVAPLDRRARGLFAPRLGVLRARVGRSEARATLYAGESVTLEVTGSGRATARFGARRLRVERGASEAPTAGSLTAAGPESAARPEGRRLALAPPEPRPARAREAGRGVPAETVLSMLRTRLIPPARACFRRDRAGREDYAVRAEFGFRLERREVVEVGITGELPDALRRCLLETLFTLEVPSFRGTVAVHYPLRTVRVERPPTVELLPEVADELNRAVPEGEPEDAL